MDIPLIVHEGVLFEHDTIYLTGHLYRNCTFQRCTLVSHGPPFRLEKNTFVDACVWRLEMTIFDTAIVEDLKDGLLPVIESSVAQRPIAKSKKG